MKSNSIFLLVALLMGVCTVAKATDTSIFIDDTYYRILSEEDKTVELFGIFVIGENLTIPQTVTYNDVEYTVISIADSTAFYTSNPDRYTTLALPSTLKRIGKFAFGFFSNLKAVTLPEGLEEIGAEAFMESSIDQVYIPASVKHIGRRAFNPNCLKTINVATDNKAYDSREDCNAIIESSTNTLILGCINTQIPASVKVIGNSAFYGCKSLVRANLPEGLTEIKDGAFRSCTALQVIVLPHSLVSIGDISFYQCYQIQEIRIPSSVEHIGERALYGSENMHLSVESGNPYYDSREDCNAVIETKTNRLIKGSNNSHIPSTVTSIGSAAFESCTGLTEVNLPDGLTVIEGSAFDGCKNLAQVSLPESLTTIGNSAFAYTAITEMNLPDQVDSVGSYAFIACRQLERVKIPKYVKHFGDKIFGSCTSLKEVNLPSGLTKVGQGMFSYCSNLTHVEIPSSVKSIEHEAFYECGSLESVNFPNGLEVIGGSSFYRCYALKKVSLPNTVRVIYSDAFERCTSLCDVSLGNQLETIGWEVFLGSKIKEITLPATLRECGQYVFAYCDELKSITVCATTPPRIEKDWEVMVPKAKFSTITLYVPEGCGDAYRSAVEWKFFTNIVEKKMDNQTGIQVPTSSNDDTGLTYDLQGRRVQGTSMKGVYIQNGKKVVVR